MPLSLGIGIAIGIAIEFDSDSDSDTDGDTDSDRGATPSGLTDCMAHPLRDWRNPEGEDGTLRRAKRD